MARLYCHSVLAITLLLCSLSAAVGQGTTSPGAGTAPPQEVLIDSEVRIPSHTERTKAQLSASEGRDLMNDGNFANAAMSYHHALEHDNSVPGYYLALSECLRRLGNHEGADRLTRLAAQVPAQLARYEGQATSSPTAAPEPDAESPKPGSGATSMPSGTFMPPNNSEAAAIAKKARRLLEQKDFVSAARQYHMALKIDHTNPDYYKDLSECQSRLSNDELAIQLAREAIRIGGRAEDYSQLGNAFYYKGDYESALAEYVTAAKLSGHGLHYAHIAGVLIKLGDLETARKFAAAAKQLGCKEHWSFKRLRITNQSQSDARNVAPCSD